MFDDKIPHPRTNQILQREDRLEVQTPTEIGVSPRSAFFSLQSSRPGAQRVNTTATDLSNTIIHSKVSRNMILLIIICAMFSLNRVELFRSEHFIRDDSCLSTYKGANERKCVTDLKTNTEKFVSSPTPVSSYQEHLDQSRLSSTKADTLEAFLVAIKDDAPIDSYYSYCDAVSRRECHDVADTVCADVQERKCQISQKSVQESVSRQECSSPSSGLLPKFLTNMLRCQGYLAGVSLNPERPRDPCDNVKIGIVSQASSATIPGKWPNVNERKCSHQQVPVNTYDTVKRRQCQDVADTVCANANERKCQVSQRPVQETKLKRSSFSNRQIKKVKVRCNKLSTSVNSNVSKYSSRQLTSEFKINQETDCKMKKFNCDIPILISK